MSKTKFIILIIILFLSLFILTGCNYGDYTNLENYYFVIAMGFDNSDEANIKINFQIALNDSGSSSESAQSSTSEIYSVDASSINSGISILDNYLSKKLNFSHCSAIIFSEDFAKKGVKKYIDTLYNNPEFRPTCNVIISSTDSKTALECIANSTEQFSAKLYEFIVNSVNYTGYSIDSELSKFCYNLNMHGSAAIATYANIEGEILQNTGIAVFKEDKFLDHLTVLDSISYSLIKDKANTCTISMQNPFDKNDIIDVLVEIEKPTKIDVYIENNYPYIKIKSDLKYSLQSIATKTNLESSEDIAILEKQINSYLEEITLEFLYKISHVYNQDICEFKNNLSSKYLTRDELEKIKWNEIYKYSYFDIELNGKLINNGLFSEN